MRIYTHVHMDMDAASSVWAARSFIPEAAQATLVLKPSDWDGDGMEDGDIAVDLRAGGRGIKGDVDDDGITHSCFAAIIQTYAPYEDQRALQHVVRLVDAIDAQGNAMRFLAPEASLEAQKTLAATGLSAVLRALQAMSGSETYIMDRMSEILSGMLRNGRARMRASEEADQAELLEGDLVAIVRNARYHATNGILFERGVRMIVYVDGCNLGLVRHEDVLIRTDHATIRSVIAAAGEESEWFAHPAGFLYCRGSRKAPQKTRSRVDPRDLAAAAVRLLHNESAA